jgi:nondiscriminating glutamyl-tRNA synthetase
MAGFTVRTRFAPSPTGELHIGNARTALFNWLFARRSGGKFILRIEDTDLERSSAGHEKNILENLRWLGLGWDEGPDALGDKGPYRQSERLHLYREFAERLVEQGHAYRCYCSKERLEELKARQAALSVPSRYDGRCRDLKVADAPQGVVPVIRFKVPLKTVTFYDGVHGLLYFDTKTIGDFVIMGSDGIAAYNFAVVVDDAMMEITHVIRGDDHISNTPRHILIFEALGFKVPLYTHLPLVLGEDRIPLSKRDAATTLGRLREEGYLPEAIVNSVSRLGWSPGEDIMTLEALAGAFSLDKLSKSPSVFDKERLKYYNKGAIAGKDSSTLAVLLDPRASGAEAERLKEAVGAVKGNAATLQELKALTRPFIGEPEFTEEARAALNAEGAAEVLRALNEAVERTSSLDEESFKTVMEAVKEVTGAKGKRLFMPIRAALTGMTEGIELVSIFRLLGRDTVIRRLGVRA